MIIITMLVYRCETIEKSRNVSCLVLTNDSTPISSSGINETFGVTGFTSAEPMLSCIKPVDNIWFLKIFTGITAAVVLFGQLRALHAFRMFVLSSKVLHTRMLNTIMRCSMVFFDSNPIG